MRSPQLTKELERAQRRATELREEADRLVARAAREQGEDPEAAVAEAQAAVGPGLRGQRGVGHQVGPGVGRRARPGGPGAVERLPVFLVPSAPSPHGHGRVGRSAQQLVDGARHAVLGVGRRHPVGHRAHGVDRVAHGHADPRRAEHRHVVLLVADRGHRGGGTPSAAQAASTATALSTPAAVTSR